MQGQHLVELLLGLGTNAPDGVELMLDACGDNLNPLSVPDLVAGGLPPGLFLVQQHNLALEFGRAGGQELALLAGTVAQPAPIDQLVSQLQDVRCLLKKSVHVQCPVSDLGGLRPDNLLRSDSSWLDRQVSGDLLELLVKLLGLVGNLRQRNRLHGCC